MIRNFRLRRLFLGFMLFLLLPLPSVAAPPPLLDKAVVDAFAQEISGTNAEYVVQELALHHRMRGSRGFRAAADAVVRRLEDAGLQDVEMLEFPADGEIFYGTQRSRPAWDVEHAELWELSPDDKPARRIASWADRPVTLAQDSVNGEAKGPLVDVGAGASEEDYEGKNIAGSLVLTSSQPRFIAALAVEKYGAAGIVSYAQNQRSAWWRDDDSVVRWGHLDTFPEPKTFAFMVSLKQARAWRERMADGGVVRLHARVEAAQHPGAYSIPTAVVRGRDLPDEEILFSCHLDHQRPVANIDSTKLLRATFLATASAYFLADLDADDLPALARVHRRRALERAADARGRAEELDDAAEAANVLRFQRGFERAVAASVERFVDPPQAWKDEQEAFLRTLDTMLGDPSKGAPLPRAAGKVYRRAEGPKGPMTGFGYSYLADQIEQRGLPSPALQRTSGIWGSDYAYEALNLVDGRRDVQAIRDDLAAIYGPIDVEIVDEFLHVLETIGVLNAVGDGAK